MNLFKNIAFVFLSAASISVNATAMELQPVYHQGNRIEYLDFECEACRYGTVIKVCKKHRPTICGFDDPNFDCNQIECFNCPEDNAFECRKIDEDDIEIYYHISFDNGKQRCIPVSKLKRA